MRSRVEPKYRQSHIAPEAHLDNFDLSRYEVWSAGVPRLELTRGQEYREDWWLAAKEKSGSYLSSKLNIFPLEKICQDSNIGGRVLFVELKDINICVLGLTVWPPASRIDLMTVTASQAISERCNCHSHPDQLGTGEEEEGEEGNLNSDWFWERWSVKSVLSPAVTSQTQLGVSSVESALEKVDNGYWEGWRVTASGGEGSRIFVSKTVKTVVTCTWTLFYRDITSQITLLGFPLLCYFNSVKIL